ncbi:hypothetical protein BV20DRAFT_139974 [Pilatotrama ljubarskyi]|nr:hypothetical protein BV20DRAFT_139974 [Pilatotrama ljubarskyi]
MESDLSPATRISFLPLVRLRMAAALNRYGIVTSEMACAATAFLVWDTLISLAEEAEYIWSGPSGWAKWIFLLIRHVPYLVQGTVLTLVAIPGHVWDSLACTAWITYQLAAIEALTIVVEIVLIIRVYAMYNRDRVVLALILMLFAGEIAAMCTILALSIPEITFNSQCVITSTPKAFPTYWIVSLAFETMLFLLTLIKFLDTVVITQLRRQSVLFTLMRDGTWAYAVIFAVMLLNTLMYQIEHNALAGVCYFWEISVMSFAGSHVLLNLRRLALEPRDSLYDAASLTVHYSSRPARSEMRFVGDVEDMTLAEMRRLPLDPV